MVTPDDLEKDSDGEPCKWRNKYDCHECGEEWYDDYSCQVDDECPGCTARVSPSESVNLLEEWEGAAELSEDRLQAEIAEFVGEGW